MRFGTIALLGRSNVGKSTFLNRALGEDLAIVSPRPQTTRDPLLGVVNRSHSQLAFLDTPGIHSPKNELGRRMNAQAFEAARAADVLAFMTDTQGLLRSSTEPLSAEDRQLIEKLATIGAGHSVFIINKVDLLKDKSRLLPLLEQVQALKPFDAYLPISANQQADVERTLEVVEQLLEEGPVGYDPDTLTDKALSFFVREYVREQVMLHTHGEVPHAVAVALDRIEETEKLLVAEVTIWVDKPGQKPILLGKGGLGLKSVGTAARHRIEKLIDKKVYLSLFVRVSPRWKDAPTKLKELGYDDIRPSPGSVRRRPAKERTRS